MAHESVNAGTANDFIVSNNNEGDEDVKQKERAKPQQLECDFDANSQMNNPISTPFEQGDLPQSHLGSLHPSCEVNYCFHAHPFYS